MPQSVTVFFQRTDCLLEGFFIVFTDAHDFADGAHLCTQLVLDTFEFLECPAGELDDDIVTARVILIQCAVFAAGQIF